MFKNWTNRDWVWLTGLLLFIMALLVANFYKKWDPQISIIANSTSIALAVIAIFLSLKQDSDSKSTSESMRQDLSTQMGNITMLLANRKVEIEEAATSVSQSVNTNTETRNDSYTYEQLVEYGEKIKKDTIDQFKKELNEKVLDEVINLENKKSFKNDDYIRYLKRYRAFEQEVKSIITDNPNFNSFEIVNELNKKGINIDKSQLKHLINKYNRDA